MKTLWSLSRLENLEKESVEWEKGVEDEQETHTHTHKSKETENESKA